MILRRFGIILQFLETFVLEGPRAGLELNGFCFKNEWDGMKRTWAKAGESLGLKESWASVSVWDETCLKWMKKEGTFPG